MKKKIKENNDYLLDVYFIISRVYTTTLSLSEGLTVFRIIFYFFISTKS